jgi:PAS domain S-box-containing protein
MQSRPETKKNLTAVKPWSFSSSDTLFRLLVDQITDYAIFLLTPSGEVATWNPGAERIKGFKPHEIIGKHFRTFYSAEAQEAHIPEDELKVAAATGRFEDEGWRMRSDGSRFWANVIITAIRDEHGELLGFGKVTRDLSERKRAEEQLRELSYSLLKLQDQERGRLGRELHDSVGQYLVAAKMSLESLVGEGMFDEKQVRKQLEESVTIIDRAIREVRTLSYLLYPPMLDELGLPSAMRWHLDGFSKRSGIATTWEIADTGRLPQEVELALFRVFQESLTNLHRHSGAKVAHVRFQIENNAAVLEIRDEGKGLPAHLLKITPTSLVKTGVGIRGMHERMRQLGGQLSVTSCNGKGTTVRATIPLNSAASRTDVSAE